MNTLAPYAANPAHTIGRQFNEPASAPRNAFQRDRDRIIHSTAFRRLEYKTQVFVNHEGDLFRTRLTHSLEVAQLARGIARTLNLHEDLTEAIALAHDLGHTPFGHAGQDALNACMKNHGGFEHNLQSLRVVEKLEQRYAEFDGLNLTFETREGILKHCSIKNAKQLGDVGQRFLDKTSPSLEAQLTNFADEIAYNNHDVDAVSYTHLDVYKRQVVEDPNKLVRGNKPGYNGEKLSLNFQNIEVRSVLQVIADFTGLNIITSDTVSGNLTLRLKDVPWDQALDIITQSKGLAMRKTGNVIIVAPAEELAAKEKQALEAIPVSYTHLDVYKRQVHTVVANPFHSMTISSKLKQQQAAIDAPALFVACGLAMRGLSI